MKADSRGMDLLLARGIFAVVLALTALGLTGCRTYYGYNDIREVSKSPLPDGEPCDVRHYAVVTAVNGNVSLKCFKLYKLPKNTLEESRIVGRIERYCDYDGWYYFENSPYNAGWNKDAWLFSICHFFWPEHIADKTFFIQKDNLGLGVWAYLFPIAGQLGLGIDLIHAAFISCWDVPVFCFAAVGDACLFVGRCCWTGISSSCAWLWGRCFGGFGSDWHLAEHYPGVFRMISYLPFISLFMPQTPPYMTDGIGYSESVRYDPEDQTILTRTKVVELKPVQELCSRYRVVARVCCGGISCGEREFLTVESGDVALTEFLRECVKAAPLGRRDFLLSLQLCDDSGQVLLRRSVSFAPEHVMSRSAADDRAAARSGDVDCLNRLLLRRRSHVEWRQEVFIDDFALPSVGAKTK